MGLSWGGVVKGWGCKGGCQGVGLSRGGVVKGGVVR